MVMTAALTAKLRDAPANFKSAGAALNSSPYFDLFPMVGTTQGVRLDWELVRLAAHTWHLSQDSSDSGDSSSSSTSSSHTSVGSSSGDSASSSSSSSRPELATAILPLPDRFQRLSNISASECAQAAVTIVTDQQEEEQQAAQLNDVLQHLQAAGVCALDLEFSSDDAGSSSSSSASSCSSADDEEGVFSESYSAAAGDYMQSDSRLLGSVKLPPVHHHHQLLYAFTNRTVALLQLMVPAAAAAAADGGSSDNNAWPAAVYLIEVPQQQAVAQRLLSQLQPLLEDEAVVKIVHDARQVRVVGQLLRLVRCSGCAPVDARISCLCTYLRMQSARLMMSSWEFEVHVCRRQDDDHGYNILQCQLLACLTWQPPRPTHRVIHNTCCSLLFPLLQDAYVLQERFSICLKGAIDTQLLAGLVALAAAAGEDHSMDPDDESSGSRWGDHVKRLHITMLYRMYGYEHPYSRRGMHAE
jgi:hypothetical protein